MGSDDPIPISITDLVRKCNNIEVLIEKTDYWLIDLYMSQSNEQYINGWEQTRFISYITAQMQSTKKIKPKDIMEFPWDNKGDKKQNRTKVIDDNVREELINRMKKIEKSSVGRPPRQGSIFG